MRITNKLTIFECIICKYSVLYYCDLQIDIPRPNAAAFAHVVKVALKLFYAASSVTGKRNFLPFWGPQVHCTAEQQFARIVGILGDCKVVLNNAKLEPTSQSAVDRNNPVLHVEHHGQCVTGGSHHVYGALLAVFK